jgi:hypothetical protein
MPGPQIESSIELPVLRRALIWELSVLRAGVTNRSAFGKEPARRYLLP